MKRITSPRSRLASYSERGKVWMNQYIPHELRGRVRVHEVTEYRGRVKGLTQKQAHRKALKAEHRGMTRHQVEVYEGRLGAVARWHRGKRR